MCQWIYNLSVRFNFCSTEIHTRDNQASEVSKQQRSKTMGKEASKHKAMDKPVNSNLSKGPTAGKVNRVLRA